MNTELLHSNQTNGAHFLGNSVKFQRTYSFLGNNFCKITEVCSISFAIKYGFTSRIFNRNLEAVAPVVESGTIETQDQILGGLFTGIHRLCKVSLV